MERGGHLVSFLCKCYNKVVRNVYNIRLVKCEEVMLNSKHINESLVILNIREQTVLRVHTDV